MSPTRPPRAREAHAEEPAPCACCGKLAAGDEAATCAICRRRVCRGCVRPYGHHMLACVECKLAEW